MGEVDGPEYRCCCGCCHLTTGSLIIGVLFMIYYVVTLGGGVFRLYEGISADEKLEQFLPVSILLIVGALVAIIAAIFMMHGIRRRRSSWMIPFLIIAIIFFVIYYVTALQSVISLVYGSEDAFCITENNRHATNTKLALSLLLRDLILLFMAYLYFVVFRCYRYIKAFP